jgi:hypothetical protein
MMRTLQINLHAEEDCNALSIAEKQKRGEKYIYYNIITVLMCNYYLIYKFFKTFLKLQVKS